MKRFVNTFLLIFISYLSFAQPGSNDYSFNPDDTGINRGSLVSGIVYTSCVQPDGKIVIGGNFTAVNGVTRANIARLNPNGTLDSSFNVNYTSGGTSNYTARVSVIQPDGKILMAINQNSSSNSEVIRINTDGTLETVIAYTNGDVLTISLQSDGKIIIGGEFTEVDTQTRSKIARMNNDGSVDFSFNSGNGVFGTVCSSVIQPNGQILIGGNFSTVNYTSVNDIARLNNDGTVDASFNPGTGVDYFVRSMSLQADGKILIGGNFTTVGGFAINRIARLNTDGTRDSSFNPGTGINQNDVWTIQCQSNGKILVGGYFNTVNDSIHHGIVRFETDGSIDSTFNINLPNNTLIYSVSIASSGRIVIGGTFSTVNDVPFNKIVKVNEDGTLDDIFNSGTGATNSVYTLSLQADGKLIAGGVFYSINNAYRTSIARLNPQDGNLDSTFEIGTGAFLNVSASCIQPDGKILLGGNFTIFNDTLINRIIRLNPDGSIDQSFNAGSGANGAVTTIVLQADGKILIGGEFNMVNDILMSQIARLNTDGSLDMSFTVGSGFNNYVTAIALQPDGKILVSGNFTSFNGVSNNRIVRLNNDGTLDPAFSVGSGANNAANTIAIQPDGKILAGGSFTTINGNTCKALVRLNADGTMDPGFNLLTMSGSVNSISALVIQSNGKIIVGGLFSTINGISRKNIARLNFDGTLDTSFNPGTGANSTVTNLAIQADGRILFSGNFTTYNGIKRNRIARVLDCHPVNEISQVISCGDYYWGQTGITYSTSGVYSESFVSLGGCDSIITLDLTINQTTDSIFVSTCDSYTLNGQTYTSSGIYTQQFTNIFGCDSNIVLNLTVHNPTFSTINTTACGSFTFNGNLYTVSGQYMDTIPNAVGCDSIITLNLTITNSNAGIDVQTACDSYTWIDGNTYTSSTNTPTFVLQNVVGCDSTVTLDLTITNSTSGIDVQVACDSLTWIDGITYYSSTSTPTFVLQNVAGCDSTVTLNLTINHPNTGIDVQTTCDSLTWIDGITYYSSTSTPTFVLQNVTGCDSTVTLNLTIIPPLPLTIENSFSLPSDANSCTGEIAITVSGNADFELDFDNGSQVVTSSGYSLVTGLCAGVHDLHVTSNCGDTLSTTLVIPVDSNYVFNNPFIDSLAQDSLGVTLTNCDIYYAGIDTAYIDSIWANGNTVNVIWNIVDSNGSNFDTTSYVLNNGNGVYWLQLSVFCPNKSLGEYFTVTEAIYFNNGNVSTAGLSESDKNLFELYPNPTTSQVHISFSGADADLTVYDVQGKVVLKDKIQNNGTVSLENLERGVYLFDFKNSNGHSVKRVVMN